MYTVYRPYCKLSFYGTSFEALVLLQSYKSFIDLCTLSRNKSPRSQDLYPNIFNLITEANGHYLHFTIRAHLF